MMKLCSAATGSGSPAASKNADMNCRVGTGRSATSPAATPHGFRSGQHGHQRLRRRVDRRRLELVNRVARLLQSVGGPADAVLHLLRGALASGVEHDGHLGGLARFRPAERCGHRPRISPCGPSNYREHLSEIRNPPGERAGDLGQLHADGRDVGGFDSGCLRDPSQRGLQRAYTAALRWMAERSQAVVAKTQRTHPGRERQPRRRSRRRSSRTVPGIHRRSPQLARSASGCRWEGSCGRSGCPRLP